MIATLMLIIYNLYMKMGILENLDFVVVVE
jgi:hypothetical protein